MKSFSTAWIGLLLAGLLAGCSTPGSRRARPATSFLPMEAKTIYSIRYLPATRELTVILRTSEVVEYRDVPDSVVEAWKRAPDQDAFYQEQIVTSNKGLKDEQPAPQPETSSGGTPEERKP